MKKNAQPWRADWRLKQIKMKHIKLKNEHCQHYRQLVSKQRVRQKREQKNQKKNKKNATFDERIGGLEIK